MNVRPVSTSGPVKGIVRVPGSKSITNRALICAALARGESLIVSGSDSDDTALLVNGLNQLGVLVRRISAGLLVSGTAGNLYAPKFPIPVGNAGTTFRFLLGATCLARGRSVLEGNDRMAERPINELLQGLRTLGGKVTRPLPIARYEVDGPSLTGGEVRTKGSESSQFVSSMLLVAPYAEKDVTVVVEGPLASAPYVSMTLAVMRSFGVTVQTSDRRRFHVPAPQQYVPSRYEVEPDASSATYFLAAAAVTGGEVVVEGLHGSSLQSDAGFAGILTEMGCDVKACPEGLRIRGPVRMRGIEVDMNSMPDTVPALAAVALFADGPTVIRNVAHLRFKESDRLDALATELARLGADVRLQNDGLTIVPVPLRGGRLNTQSDHRLAMAFAVIGLRVPGLEVTEPECVRKSFPTFWETLDAIMIPAARKE